MTSYTTYILVQVIPMIVCSAIITAGVAIVGFFILGPAETVKIMFPYIEKEDNGNSLFMYRFKLKKPYVIALFIIMLANVFITMMIFWANILIERSSGYNPYEGSDCFFSNGTRVTLSPAESLMLDERVECFSWSPDPIGALGDATGALAFAWGVVSVLTWIVLHWSKLASDQTGVKKCCAYLFLSAFQLSVYVVSLCIIIIAVVYRQYFTLISFLQLIFFSFLLGGSGTVLWWLVEEP